MYKKLSVNKKTEILKQYKKIRNSEYCSKIYNDDIDQLAEISKDNLEDI